MANKDNGVPLGQNETYSASEPEAPTEEYPPGIAFGPTVLERLLLAIIDGNPASSSDGRRQRLDVAMKALTGKKASPNPLPDDHDDKALVFMGHERHRDKCYRDEHLIKNHLKKITASTPPPQIRSDKALAELAETKFFGSTDPQAKHSNANRLREKFSGAYMRKQGKGTDIDSERTYMYRAVEHDYIEESFENQGLKRLCDELAVWGIKTKL